MPLLIFNIHSLLQKLAIIFLRALLMPPLVKTNIRDRGKENFEIQGKGEYRHFLILNLFLYAKSFRDYSWDF